MFFVFQGEAVTGVRDSDLSELRRDTSENRPHGHRKHWAIVMRPTRQKLFSISTSLEVAKLLKASLGEINHLLSRLKKQYVPRNAGSATALSESCLCPASGSRSCSVKSTTHILCKAPLLPCVTGGVKGKSPIENASIHTNQEVVFKMDIAQCFPSIGSSRVLAMFQSLGFGPEAAGLLTKLTTWNNELDAGRGAQ